MPTRTTDHGIPRRGISKNAIAVVQRLRELGFEAYLVGGCVRDLLLGRTPKDFDVVSNATPDDVRKGFSRVRLVGRRFRIAHVWSGREVTEVSTFRSAAEAPQADAGARLRDRSRHLSAAGLILRDNAYGTMDEDVFRRDFTINALYYDPIDDVLIDYCDGMADIRARTLRLIGDPEMRFREDPVRMLRALRFAAKLDLKLDPQLARAIAPMAELVASVPPARLFDEFSKLFMGGHGERVFDLLRQHRLLDVLMRTPAEGEAISRAALASTDRRLREDKPVTPGFLLAAFLWPDYVVRSATPPQGLRKKAGAVEAWRDEAAWNAIGEQRATLSIPRRHSYFVLDVWRLQPALESRDGVPAVLAHRRFRAAYDFLLLRVAVGEVAKELGDWWTEAQEQDPEELARELAPPRKRRRRPRYKRRRANGQAAAGSAGGG